MPGSRLSATVAGRGEPLLLVHGIGSSRKVWQPLLPALAERYAVHAVDLPGFGSSPLGDVEPSVDGYADVLDGYCRRLGLIRPRVAGHSLGGAVALELGRRGSAGSVVAVAPVGFWGASGVTWCQAALRGVHALAPRVRPVLPALVRCAAGRWLAGGLFYGAPGRTPPAAVVADADAFRAGAAFPAACASFGDYVFGDPGALTDIPVTVVWGTRDALLPWRTQAARARQALPWARHVRLAGCGHLPFADDPVSCLLVLSDGWS